MPKAQVPGAGPNIGAANLTQIFPANVPMATLAGELVDASADVTTSTRPTGTVSSSCAASAIRGS